MSHCDEIDHRRTHSDIENRYTYDLPNRALTIIENQYDVLQQALKKNRFTNEKSVYGALRRVYRKLINLILKFYIIMIFFFLFQIVVDR